MIVNREIKDGDKHGISEMFIFNKKDEPFTTTSDFYNEVNIFLDEFDFVLYAKSSILFKKRKQNPLFHKMRLFSHKYAFTFYDKKVSWRCRDKDGKRRLDKEYFSYSVPLICIGHLLEEAPRTEVVEVEFPKESDEDFETQRRKVLLECLEKDLHFNQNAIEVINKEDKNILHLETIEERFVK